MVTLAWRAAPGEAVLAGTDSGSRSPRSPAAPMPASSPSCSARGRRSSPWRGRRSWLVDRGRPPRPPRDAARRHGGRPGLAPGRGHARVRPRRDAVPPRVRPGSRPSRSPPPCADGPHRAWCLVRRAPEARIRFGAARWPRRRPPRWRGRAPRTRTAHPTTFGCGAGRCSGPGTCPVGTAARRSLDHAGLTAVLAAESVPDGHGHLGGRVRHPRPPRRARYRVGVKRRSLATTWGLSSSSSGNPSVTRGLLG